MTDAYKLKTVALEWLRYGKRLPLVCTEVGRWNADVLGVSPTTAVEVEVKVTKSDLRAEFRNKISKHYVYNNATEQSQVPNQFYILVPVDLAEAALEVVEEAKSKAGVAAVDLSLYGSPYNRDVVAVRKRATRLKNAPPNAMLIATAMQRCSSELTGLYHWKTDFLRRLDTQIEDGLKSIVQHAVRAAGTLDYEEPTNDLELRAKELAAAVEQIGDDEWFELDVAKKTKWLEAAARLLSATHLSMRGWARESFTD